MRFKTIWKTAAETYARCARHTDTYRYFHYASASKAQRADAAMSQFRCELSHAAQRYMAHPRSKHWERAVFNAARELARLGRYKLALA